MLEYDGRTGLTGSTRCVDKLLMFELQELRTDQSRCTLPRHQPESHEHSHGALVAPDDDAYQDHDQQIGKRVQDIDNPHQHSVYFTSVEAGDRTVDGADHKC